MCRSIFHIILLAALIPLSMGLVSCRDHEKLEKALKPHVKFHPQMDEDQKEAALDAVGTLLELEINAKKGSYFEKAFGGTQTKHLLYYLKKRIHFVVSDKQISNIFGKKRSQKHSTVARRIIDALTMPSENPNYGAQNIGVGLWYDNLLRRRLSPAPFKFGKRRVAIHGPRVGIIGLSDHYVNADIIYQMSTLIHEARHSDCTEGITYADLKNIRQHGYRSRQLKRSCGHLHVVCPWDQDKKNPPMACDGHPWGAFAIEVLFLDAIINDCNNCSNSMRRSARRLRSNRMYYILPGEKLFRGFYGPPNMTSSGLRVK